MKTEWCREQKSFFFFFFILISGNFFFSEVSSSTPLAQEPPIMFDSGASVSSASCCFYSVANCPLLHPPRWKKNPDCGTVVSAPPPASEHCQRNYISHASLWSDLRGFFFLLFFWRNRAELLSLCRRKFSLAVAVHWVARSGKCRCSDSVCLPDYLKVTLFQRANRRTSFCLGLYSLLCLPTNYTVIQWRRSIIWQW